MSNSYFEEIPKTTSLDDLAIQNRNWDKAAAKLDSHQAQLTAEQQARLAQVQSHISAIAAHAAAAITLSPVTGLNANNLQTAVEQLRTMLTTIIAGPAPSAAEIQAARVGADNIARKSLDILIKEIHAQQLAANTATAQLKHGQNVINASEAGPVAVTIKGNTLVNLLGNIGNFEVDSNNDGVADGFGSNFLRGAKATLETSGAIYGTKAQRITATVSDTATERSITRAITTRSGSMYLVLVDVLTDGISIPKINIQQDSNWFVATGTANSKLLYCKLIGTDPTYAAINLINNNPVGQAGWVQFDGLRMYEIDAATYAKVDVDPEWSGDKLAARYPYVDGVKHVTNPAITKIGKNLLPPLTQQWALGGVGATQSIKGPYETEVTSVNWSTGPDITIDAMPNRAYTFSINDVNGTLTDNAFDIWSLDASNISTTIAYNNTSSPYTFNTPSSCMKLRLKIKNVLEATTFTVKNPMLVLGNTSMLFEPRNDDYCYAVTTLAGYGGVNDVFTIRGIEATVLRRWKTDLVLDGSLSWNHYTSSVVSGRKYVVAPKTNFPLSWQDAGECTLVSLIGIPLINMKLFTSLNAANQMSMGPSSLTVTIANADSGWGDDFNPSSAEVRAYFWGWKMNNGTFGQPYNGSGTKTWTRWDATSNTGAVNTVPTAMANGYTPYKLSYQLATPITEVVPVEGSLANHAGTNLYEMSEGVLVREKTVPEYGNYGFAVIGASSAYYNTTNRLQHSPSKFLSVYKNGVLDIGWFNDPGGNRVLLQRLKFDPTAEYTVTYLSADKYALTAPVVDGTLDYQTSSKSVQQALVQRTADAETAITIHDLILAQHTARLLALEA